jgi:hypothetical protein
VEATVEQNQAATQTSTDDIAAAQSAPAQQADGASVAPAPDEEQAAATEQAEAEQTGEPDARPGEQAGSPLLPDDRSAELRNRWREVQTQFVDDPREAVTAADALVAELMQTLASGFADRRHALEEQWQRGEDVGTEDLRVVLQKYRAFFDRLLSA